MLSLTNPCLYVQFHNPRFQRIKVTEKDVIVPFVVMFSVNVILLLCWTLINPLRWEIVIVNEFNSYGRCNPEGDGIASIVFMSLILAVNVLALVLANVQAYQARMISDEFSESQYIGLAMFAVLEVFLFTFPISFLVADNPQARYFVYSGIIFVVSMSLLLLVFVPKLKLLLEAMNTRSPGRRTSFTRGMGRQSSGDFGIRFTNVSYIKRCEEEVARVVFVCVSNLHCLNYSLTLFISIFLCGSFKMQMLQD